MAPSDEARLARDEALSKYQADLDRLAAGEVVALELHDIRIRNGFAEQILAVFGGKK